MRTLVFGDGWLGNQFATVFDAPVSAAEIADPVQVRESIKAVQPQLVINCAGKTGRPNVDWCEASRDNRRLTWMANAVGPSVIEQACLQCGVPQFVHISSGCLWATGTDLTEREPPKPCSYYGETKAAGEARLNTKYTLIIRPRMPFDSNNHPRNLITKLLGYTSLIDVQNSLTYIPDMMDAVKALLRVRAKGAYNVVNKGSLSPADIVTMYRGDASTFKTVPLEHLTESGAIKTGRSGVTLSTTKLTRDTGFVMPDVEKQMVHSIFFHKHTVTG